MTYTPEQIRADVQYGYAMLTRIKEMSGGGSAEAGTMRRLLSLAERVASASTIEVASWNGLACVMPQNVDLALADKTVALVVL